MNALRKRGRIALMGGLDGETRIPYFTAILKSLEFKARWMYTRKELRELVKLVETGVLKIGKSAGHKVKGRYKLEQWETALQEAAKHSAFGEQVVFVPQEE
ncbi:hypothetical protein F5Y15DRAFT_418585 [Xylariaceae sp. FL0016]|nr:hypothetical protein F5Y15DRAFT_418585 [Xylariaceae sp. FL0016]